MNKCLGFVKSVEELEEWRNEICSDRGSPTNWSTLPDGIANEPQFPF